MSKVFVLILNYKKWMDTRECLETLLRCDYQNFTAIVIDNDSQNKSLEQLSYWATNDTGNPTLITSFSRKELAKPVNCALMHIREFAADSHANSKLLLVQNDQNDGFGRGINKVLSQLVHEDAFVWLLNPDMIVEETTLSELVHFAASSSRKVIIGSEIRYYCNPGAVHLYAGGKINFNSATIDMITDKRKIKELDYVSGGAMFTHTSTYADLGLLPEKYFLYWEETDFCFNAKTRGYSLLLCDKAVCYDKVSTSIGKSFLSDFYYTRNGLLFLEKYKKNKINTALFFTVFRLLKRILTGRVDRAKGMYKGIIAFLNKASA